MDDVNHFITGFGRFQKKYFSSDQELYDQLRVGQRPKALVIACCDSRADPAIITDCNPGELFVVRNVANLVPPYETDGGIHGVSAALEFGVKSLNVEHIIILGHALCGGINALMQGELKAEESEFIGPWMRIADRARTDVLDRLGHKSMDEQTRACEKAAILTSLENLITFPWIEERVNAGTLRLHGWYFDLVRGALLGYNSDTDRFTPLVAAPFATAVR
ncbi:MAG: carbonic anhydrase [Pseudomonadota bacterium]